MQRDLIRRALHQAAASLLYDSSSETATEQERGALRTLVVVLRQEFDDALFAAEKAGAANGVLYALNPETSPWATVGVYGEAEQAIWELYGFGPQGAKDWIDAGYDADTAFEWRAHETDYAFACLRREWTPKEGGEWRGWDADDAQRWIDAGADRNIATHWKTHGPENVAHVKQLKAWETNFWRIPDEEKYAEAWGDTPLADAVLLLPKGYTLRSAQLAQKKGFTAKTAPPARGTALVAGKAFPKLVALATEVGGWSVPRSVGDIDGLDTAPTVETTFHHPDHRRRLDVTFAASGRFLVGRDSWERPTLRSVKEVEAVLSQPSRRLLRRR